MLSGTNYDTNTRVLFMDTGMIFVPSIDGISPNPAEKLNWNYIETSANILLEILEGVDE